MQKRTDPHTRYWVIEVSAGHMWLLRHFTGQHVVTLCEYRSKPDAEAALRKCHAEIGHTKEKEDA